MVYLFRIEVKVGNAFHTGYMEAMGGLRMMSMEINGYSWILVHGFINLTGS
jgi:hypothetical protein